MFFLQMTGEDNACSEGEEVDMESSINKPVFLVPTESPGRR